jgi:REP element-mobilizing transposase RayT
MRDRYKVIDDNGVYFMTSTIIQWIPVFNSTPYFNLIIESFEYCILNKGLNLFAYVIMDNHFHCIVSGQNISSTMSSLKMFTAKRIIEQAKRDGKDWILNQFMFYKKRYKKDSSHQVWQEGLHPVLIQNDEMFIQKAEYIHYNPVRRGYISQPEHWLYSSARNYLSGDDSIIPVILDLVS